MSKIPEFDKFNEAIVAAGFGQMNINNFALGGATPQTGYSMTPIAGVVESCSNHVAEQANMYEGNDNDDHTAESYMKEAKDHINESMDKAYESYAATNEGVKGYDVGKWLKDFDGMDFNKAQYEISDDKDYHDAVDEDGWKSIFKIAKKYKAKLKKHNIKSDKDLENFAKWLSSGDHMKSESATNEGMSKSAIKKMIKVIDKQIDTETGGDGEALDNETLQALEKERERLSAMNEAMVQVAGKDKPSGAKVLASVIVDLLIDKKIVTRAAERKLTAEIQDLIIKSTF